MNDNNRSNLKKFLGKKCLFTGTIRRRENSQMLIVNIKYKNKPITDHIWCNETNNNKMFKKKSEISFIATIITYTDSRGYRKYGLEKIHRFQIVSKETREYKKNKYERRKRLNKQG